MYIKLKFDYYSCNIYIPDCYLNNFENLQENFLEWMYEQPECFLNLKSSKIGYSYNENDFIKYLNTVILSDCNEKAYLAKRNIKSVKKTIVF